MALYMNRVIDLDMSKAENKFTVKAGVDPDLDLSKYHFILFYVHFKTIFIREILSPNLLPQPYILLLQ